MILVSHSISLANRYPVPYVNEVFKYNILLTVKYMGTEFELRPGEQFAFHGKGDKTTNANFGYNQGFKSDGYLTGDGVCHLASLMYMVAKNAGLETYAPANHNFAAIPGIPREYGVSIYSGTPQNLYITNNKPYPIKFVFDNRGDTLTLTIKESFAKNIQANWIVNRDRYNLMPKSL